MARPESSKPTLSNKGLCDMIDERFSAAEAQRMKEALGNCDDVPLGQPARPTSTPPVAVPTQAQRE